MRSVVLLWVIANLAFLAWAVWIDAPQPAPTNEAFAKLPRLKLVNELPAGDARPASSGGTTRKTGLDFTPQPALAPAPAPAPALIATARCLSVGPFDDQPSATRGASQLREKGLAPRQRLEKGEISKGFWVYIGGLKTDGDVADVLRTLEQSHVEDAHLMSDAGDSHQVSVGLFSERERADKRAGSVEKLGLHPVVAERKLAATVFWMDVDVPPGGAELTAQDVGLQGAQGLGSHVQVAPCPVGSSPETTPTPAPTTPFRTKVAGAAPAPKVP